MSTSKTILHCQPVKPFYVVNKLHLANDLVKEALKTPDIPVIRARRLTSRNSKPGIVKIEFQTLDEKKRILREKSNLKNANMFRNTYIRSPKSHVERLLQLNIQLLLQELPNGHNYCLSANGCLLWNGHQQQQQGEYNRRDPGPGPGPGPSGSPHMMEPQGMTLPQRPQMNTYRHQGPDPPFPWRMGPSEFQPRQPAPTVQPVIVHPPRQPTPQPSQS